MAGQFNQVLEQDVKKVTQEPIKDLLQSKQSRPFCRICHECASESKLLSPCMCIGTVRNVHRRCLEHWLTSSRSSTCELCGYVYTLAPTFPGVCEWLKRNPRPLIIDLVLTLFLTPLAMFSVVLCYRGAIVQVEVRNTVESLSLFALGSFLTGVYLAWMALTVRSQFKAFRSWARSHPKMSLVYPSSPISIVVGATGRPIKPRDRMPARIMTSSPQNTGCPIPRLHRVLSVVSLEDDTISWNRDHVDSNIIREEIEAMNREHRDMWRVWIPRESDSLNQLIKVFNFCYH